MNKLMSKGKEKKNNTYLNSISSMENEIKK